jgi:hypothetical protein
LLSCQSVVVPFSLSANHAMGRQWDRKTPQWRHQAQGAGCGRRPQRAFCRAPARANSLFPGVAGARQNGLLALAEKRGIRGSAMKHVGAILVLCGAAALAVAPGVANAFEYQGAPDPSNLASLAAPQQNLFSTDFKAYSLAMPLTGKGDDSGAISSYGNAIPIPAPGIDLPAPAWAYSPGGRSIFGN